MAFKALTYLLPSVLSVIAQHYGYAVNPGHSSHQCGLAVIPELFFMFVAAAAVFVAAIGVIGLLLLVALSRLHKHV
jgi:hypothetical protein